MNNILFLYDTKEEDLARDFKDFFNELNINIEMISLAHNKGKTLQDKEDHYFDSADGAIFLITPRIENFPSSSVSDEMGQAKQKFKDKPEKIIYLVDKNCTVQVIDQKPYIKFDRNNIRSIVKAITLLIKDLKQSGLLGGKKIEPKETHIDIVKYSESINETLKKICFDLSDKKNGFINSIDLDNLLQTKYRMRQRDINFTIRTLKKKGLITYLQLYNGWQLSDIGFELVRHEMEIEKKKRASNPFLGLLGNVPALGGLPAISTNYAIPLTKKLGLLTQELKRKK